MAESVRCPCPAFDWSGSTIDDLVQICECDHVDDEHEEGTGACQAGIEVSD